ncbi:hypothetical protein F4818DRAFT_449915 [Hypoxylon cercidicola]|nr:hypothetical protein F4818DRAFT_449915 [Hypoxylon cercidicola]
MDSSAIPDAEGSVEKFLHIPYDQRWEKLKPTIIHIYMEEKSRIPALAKRMKEVYSFDAQAHQYRYYFKKWDIKKRITTEEKGAVISALGKRRLREGVSTSDATIDQGGIEKAVDKKQLKRYINQSIRESESMTWNPGLFLQHALPYAAYLRSVGDHPSPSGAGPATPAYLTIDSPHANGSPPASQNAMTPTMQLVQRKVLLDRAKLFIEGRAQDLMAQMTSEDRESTITWLHDFWMYSFMTAKYWGKGPKIWTPSLINFKSFAGNPVPSTPGHQIEQGQGSESLPPSGNSLPFNNPTQLCRWAIYYKEDLDYESIPSPSVAREESEEQFDIDDESTWTQWPSSGISPSISATIMQGLQQNVFTEVQNETLPMAADSIIKTMEKSPEALQAEALGFAIMSRNVDAINQIVESVSFRSSPEILAVSPFHLAAQYLDGAKSCCMVMEILVHGLKNRNSIGINYTSRSGHTVLDTLFITILRSHSTISPHILSDKFIGQSRYSGQEVDPCGRWDADSPCIRQLYASGKQTIPHGWKHIFCHTSVQAVCHSISVIFDALQRPNINTPSGLFSSRCNCCGLKLTLGPLHALILTAFHLANHGCPGETLFGIVSCLVCLLVYRADPCAAEEVSVPAVLGLDTADDTCQHLRLNAAELASRVPLETMNTWTPEVRMGWNALIAILEHDIASRRSKRMASKRQTTATENNFSIDTSGNASIDTEDSEDEPCNHCIHEDERDDWKFVYCGNQKLGPIWAIIQAELLTYRRLDEHDSWLSTRFRMEDIVDGLRENDDAYLDRLLSGTENIEGYKLKRYSRCGFFFEAEVAGCARREEACESYYANFDDWKRTNFIQAR